MFHYVTTTLLLNYLKHIFHFSTSCPYNVPEDIYSDEHRYVCDKPILTAGNINNWLAFD